jgi:O-antigen ligase/polysaccharide polymerase Wzy-like membrane protein
MTAAVDSRRTLIVAAFLGSYAALLALVSDLRIVLALTAPLIAIPLLWWTIQTPTRWLALFFFSALLLPPLPIAIGDSGPHIALAFAAVGLLAGIVRMTDWRIPARSLTISMLIFAAVLLTSVSFAALYSGATVALASLARVALFAISVYIFLYTGYGPAARNATDPLRAVRLMFALAVASALFACLDFYFQFPAPAGYGPQFVWLDTGVYRRAQGVFYEASTLGNFCAFFLVMIAVAMSGPKSVSPIARRSMFFGGAVLSAALVFSYSRGSLINVVVAVLALLYLRRERVNFRRLALASMLILTAAAVTVYGVFPSFAQNYWTRLSLSFENFFSATNGILSGRLDSWGLLAGFLADQPWHALAGIGYKTLPYSDFVGRGVVADNMYLSLLVETGVIGLAVFLAFNAAVLRASWRAARSVDSRTAFFGAWMFCFWAGEMVQMLSGDLFTYWRVLPVYFWVLGLAVRAES